MNLIGQHKHEHKMNFGSAHHMEIIKYSKCPKYIQDEIVRQFLTEMHDYKDKNYVHTWITELLEDNGQFYVMVSQDMKFIGTIGIQFGETHIDGVLVSQPYRRQGYGKRLLAFAEKQLKKKQANQVSLYCYEHMRSFYINLGWTHNGIIKMKNGLFGHVMKKKL